MSQNSLSELYNRTSNHSNYQELARPLRAIIQQESLKINPRYDTERLDFILPRCSVSRKVVADIGGNTGFFSLECAAYGASTVLYFEGNKVHSEFVREAVHVLNLDKVVEVFTKYIHFRDDFNCHADVCFLLNVLHHIGDDYGDSAISRDEAKKEVLDSLSYMSRKAKMLIFQLGFNWKGDRNLPLFEHGTKADLIDFIHKGTVDDWEILNIGIAQRSEISVEYQELNETNTKRDDLQGEFLNRPLFVMKSKNF